MGRRPPVAEAGDEDYRIVRHTHDVAEATTLMRAYLGDHREVGCDEVCAERGCDGAVKVGTPHRVHVRILPALPNSYAAAEGWAFTYHECEPGRGAFPAVVFR